MYETGIESKSKRMEVHLQRAQPVETLAKLKNVGKVARRKFEKKHG